ncbi:hypothetical protein V8F20_003340 [Naviculisporaceae sp. PSN 640]
MSSPSANSQQPPTPYESPIKNVALVGAQGSLGSVILSVLLASPHLSKIFIIRRDSSASPTPEPHPKLSIITVSSAWDQIELASSFRSHDIHAVISAFPVRNVNEHIALANAAYESGTVRRFIPADFGSVDARSDYARQLVPLFERKVRIRERLEELSAFSLSTSESERVEFSYTSLVNGHFFDWGLTNGFLHFYPHENPPRAEILGTGNEKSSLTTLPKVAEAVVRILTIVPLDRTKNRVLMIQSFCVSQLDVLESLRKVREELDMTRGKETETEWKVEYRDLEGFIAEKKDVADKGDKEAVEDLVFALGIVDGNWEEKEDFAMGLLGLEEDDLDTEVRRALGGGK